MTISALGRYTSWLNRSLPAVSLCVKNSQVVMVFLSVIPSKNVQFVFEKCRCVIFDLRSLNYCVWAINILLVSINALIRPQAIQESSEASLPWLLLAIALAYENPFELLRYLFAGQRKVVWRIIRMRLVGHADVLLALFLLCLVVIWLRDDVHSIVDDSPLLLVLLSWRNDLAHARHVRDWPVCSRGRGVWFFVIPFLTTFAVIYVQLVLPFVWFSLHNNK